MLVQITSGNGPLEASLAVQKVFDYIQHNFCLDIVEGSVKKYTNEKSVNGLPRSIFFDVEEPEDDSKYDHYSELLDLDGTWKVVFNSPFRNTKRKNWFVKVTCIEEMDYDPNITIPNMYQEGDFMIIPFKKAKGHGGQNVNKVETGIAVTYIPDNITVESCKFRSQYLNRKDALAKIYKKLDTIQVQKLAEIEKRFWEYHSKVERGNEVKVIRC